MTEKTLNQKIETLEKDVSEIKRCLGFFGAFREDKDFENWRKVKKTSRKIRKELFKEKYPKLYEKLSKGR